jgi:hypothetical protein
VIRNDLGKQFKARVEHWHGEYYKRIEGRANDARIATNHACLAAAFELFAEFMKDVWPGAEQAAHDFATDYVGNLVLEAAGAVEDETPAGIFLSTLGELIAFEQARIDGIGSTRKSDDQCEKDRFVGRLIQPFPAPYGGINALPDNALIHISVSMCLATVQEHLAGQRRQPLQISTRALLDQLVAMGVLVDENNSPIKKDHAGERTTKVRIDGKSVNCARIKAAAFRKYWSASAAPASATTGNSWEPNRFALSGQANAV